jgi:hypothetical protein
MSTDEAPVAVTLDRHLNLLRFVLSDSFRSNHRQLEAAGVVRHSIEKDMREWPKLVEVEKPLR